MPTWCSASKWPGCQLQGLFIGGQRLRQGTLAMPVQPVREQPVGFLHRARRSCSAPCHARRGGAHAREHRRPVFADALADTAARSGTTGCRCVPASSANRSASGTRIHTGLPSAPARWAMLVSTAITRSIAAHRAAVSAKSCKPAAQSRTGLAASSGRSASRYSFCSETKSQSASSNAASLAKPMLRLWSFLCTGLPLQARPTRGLPPSPSLARHACSRTGSQAR